MVMEILIETVAGLHKMRSTVVRDDTTKKLR